MKQWYKSNYDDVCPNVTEFKKYVHKNISTYNTDANIITKYIIKTGSIGLIEELENCGETNELVEI